MGATDFNRFPAVDEVRELPLQLSMKVPPDWEDRNGHVNVQFYLALYELGGWRVLEEVGFDEQWFEQSGVSMFDLEHHLHFRAEIHVGEQVSTYNRVLGHSDKRFHGMYFIINDHHDRLACVLEYITCCVDMQQRRSAPFPPLLMRGIKILHHRHEKLAWPAPVCGSMSL